MKYLLFGKKTESDIELPCAYETDFDEPEVVICGDDNKRFNELNSRDDINSKLGYRYINKEKAELFFKTEGSFSVTNGNRISYCLAENADMAAVEQTFLCVLFPYLIIQNGGFQMHGSSVMCKDKFVIISGVSGAGKSSLANAVVDKYGKYLSDDIIPIKVDDGKVYTLPTFPTRKLCQDIAKKYDLTGKKLVRIPDEGGDKVGLVEPNSFVTENKQLSAMFVLYPGDVAEPTIEEIVGAEKLKYITDNVFRGKDLQQIGYHAEFMKAVMTMASVLPIYKVTRPRTGLTVDKQLELVEGVL